MTALRKQVVSPLFYGAAAVLSDNGAVEFKGG
jgi:hypothetical protein